MKDTEELYYHGATQLRFRVPYSSAIHCGIGYHGHIIDAKTGQVFSTKYILNSSSVDPDETIIEWSDWRDLSDSF